MCNTFRVYWKSNATMNDITKMIGKLSDIGPGPVKQKDDHLKAELDWGVDRRSVNNLAGALNAVSNNKVSKVEGVADSDSSSESDSD